MSGSRVWGIYARAGGGDVETRQRVQSLRAARGPAAPEGPAVHVRGATDGRDMIVNDPGGWEVDQPWLWWDGPAGGDGTGGPLGNPPPGALLPDALPAAVTRCTSIVADTLAGMPWKVRRGRERLPEPDWITDPQATRRDQRIYGGAVPDTRRSAVEFRAWSITSMLWLGESIWYVPNRNDDGSPAPPIWQLNPGLIGEEDGSYFAPAVDEFAGDGGGAGPYYFEPGELIVIRGLLRDGPRGIGVLQAHWLDLALAGEVRGYGYNMLRAGVPNGYLKVNAPNLTKDKARELQDDWMTAHGGRRKKIAVLNATTDFHAISLDPQALQLAQMRDYSTLDIALIFGVPPYMLGITQSRDTYANVESRMIELSQFTLLPWARRIESALDSEFARGTELKIAMDALRRADTATRYAAHKIGLDAGFLTVEEVRDLEDLPPMEAAEAAAGQQATGAAMRVLRGGPRVQELNT
jgi:phage portal protein BeeE